MSKPALSIILPVYNVEPYIRECIDSILSQSYIDFELIIIDDQSTDNSADICAQYQKTDDRIRLFHNVQNLGLSETRNIGIEKAQGEYLSFIDSDDYIGTGMYSDMISKIIENDADICMCNYFWVDENGQQMSQYISENSGKILIGQDKVRENILTHNNCVWNKLFKKRLFSKIKFPEGKVFEDIFIMHELFESADRVYITEGSFYYYRRRKQSITARPFQISNFDLIDAVIAKYLFVKDGYETDIVESSAEFVLFNFVYCVNRIISEDKVKQFKEKVKEYSIIINKLGVVLSSDNNDLNTAYKLIAKDIRLYQFAVMK